MSDEVNVLQQYSTRIAEATIAAWWFIVRVLFGWHFKAIEKIDQKLDVINGRISNLEGRNMQRDVGEKVRTRKRRGDR
jgi:hypothetical protein